VRKASSDKIELNVSPRQNKSVNVIKAGLVIVGGGAGGLELAARLGRKSGKRKRSHAVLLVDRSPTHIWKPTLHEIAAGTLDIHSEALSYSLLARRNRFDFALGELCALDIDAKCIRLSEIRNDAGVLLVPERTIHFEQLVLALGSGSNFFGTPGAEHAFVLEHADDAEAFRHQLLAKFTQAAFSAAKQLDIAIVGAGATGVELSVELLEAHNALLESLPPELHFKLQLKIIEAAPRILSALPERLAKKAAEALKRKRIELHTGVKVSAIEVDALITSSGRIEADLIVWAAGIQAAESNQSLGLALNRNHQIIVDDRLRASAANIYAIGDCAASPWHDGKWAPARAQVASQQAKYLSKALLARSSKVPAFLFKDAGSLVSLGGQGAIGSLMGSLSGKSFFVEGLLAKIMYMSLHILHHANIIGWRSTAVLALARLLQRRVSGRFKLH
jgi:NADH:ubiquinone reductase (H+-translocating)